MEFEWDPEKSAADPAKHGIDFEEARRLWEDPDRVEIVAPYPLENRCILIGAIGAQVWSAVYTVRERALRTISVRRSRKREKQLYEKETVCERQ